MLELYENIKKRREALSMTKADLAHEIGYDRSMITKIEQGKVDLTQSKLLAFAKALKTTPAYLLGITEIHQQLSSPESSPFITYKQFPMLGEIACGKPIFADEQYCTYVNADSSIKADFCLKAVGDSMINARINDGDIVFIQKTPVVDNGQIAAVIIGDEATLKRWYYYPDMSKLILSPENPSYAPLVFIGKELESVQCLGRAVCFMSDL